MVSVPPPPRTRIAFFVLFVALVAVVTFFVLRNMMPTADSAPGSSETSTATDSGPSLGDGASAPTQGAPADAGTAASQPPPADSAPSQSPPDAGTAVAAAIDAGPKEGPDPAPSTPSSPDAGSAPPADRTSTAPPQPAETADIEPPAFAEGADGWTLTLRALAPLKIKHFWLENPPRLAVDFMGGSYGHKKLVFEAPAPGVQRLRVGKQQGFVRFVVDLDPAVNSRAEITPMENGLRIRFGKP
jgi:hypothetical protein